MRTVIEVADGLAGHGGHRRRRVCRDRVRRRGRIGGGAGRIGEEPRERGGQLGRRGPAVRVGRQAPPDDRVQRRRHLGPDRARGGHATRQAGDGHSRGGVARARALPGEHLEQDEAEAVDVGRGRGGVAARLLGAEVVDAADRHATRGDRAIRLRLAAMPKSATLTRPSGVSRMLLGLMSRWTMPRACAASSASATCCADARRGGGWQRAALARGRGEVAPGRPAP